MTPERWQQVEEVLQAALDRPAPERVDFLNQACGADDELRQEAASLISAHDEAGDFIEEPALSRDANVLANALPDENIGRHIGSYRVIQRLGSGGMGEVYLAEDSRLARLVALKILPSYLVANEGRLRRFEREARAVSALNHPNILTIHEVGEHEGIHFIATEYIDGKTIRDLISQKSLSADEVIDICLQVGAGLSVAHANGIIHRDVKPENIMQRTDGLVKVLDFGIAKPIATHGLISEDANQLTAQTEMGVVLGTVGYMSPEQARGLSVDPRTDVWSLGVLLYEMVSGRAPFAAATRMDTLVRILEHDPEPLVQKNNDAAKHLVQLQTIIDRALCKGLGHRYQSIAAMLEDLRSLQEEFRGAGESRISLDRETEPSHSNKSHDAAGLTVTARPAHTRRRATLIVAAAAVMLLIAIVSIKLTQRRPATTIALSSPPAGESFSKPYREMSETERFSFVETQAQRISALLGEHPRNLNSEAVNAIKRRVDNYVALGEKASIEPGQDDLNAIFKRAQPLIPLISRSFQARKVPVTIGIYLPMIEAAYRPCLESPFGARGLFQFLPSTAQDYGVSPDEMCDAEKMTPAAADYIADRMAELGEDSESMTLVLLSYNRGAPWVRDTLIRLRSTENFERNFWTFFAHRDKLDDSFRNESAGYVPLFFAAAIVGENPKTFGLDIPPLSSFAGDRNAK